MWASTRAMGKSFTPPGRASRWSTSRCPTCHTPEPVGRAELRAIHGSGRAWHARKLGPNSFRARRSSRLSKPTFPGPWCWIFRSPIGLAARFLVLPFGSLMCLCCPGWGEAAGLMTRPHGLASRRLCRSAPLGLAPGAGAEVDSMCSTSSARLRSANRVLAGELGTSCCSDWLRHRTTPVSPPKVDHLG
jgi:hypothetical protein